MHRATTLAVLATVAALTVVAAPLAAQGDELFSVAVGDGNLRVVDPLTATTLRTVPLTAGATAVTQCNGLAVHPFTGQLWALVRTTGPRMLATLDPATGAATVIGNTAFAFAGIAFRGDGTLFGVTGDGSASSPESLFTLDTTTATATATLVRALGAGDDGESLCFDPHRFQFFHASGLGTPNLDEVFERLDAFTGAPVNVPLSGFDYDEMLALTHWVGGNLLGSDLNDDLVLINRNGHVTLVGALDHSAKGLAFVPSQPPAGFVRAYGDACAASNGRFGLLWASGRPSPGQAFALAVQHSLPSAPGILAAGAGNGTIPSFPTVDCQVQIAPVGATVLFFTGAVGEATFALPVPPGLQPIDVFFQVGVLDGAQFVVTNPLQVHVQ